MAFEFTLRDPAIHSPLDETWRETRWDQLEERLALSAQPVADVLDQLAVEHHALEKPTPIAPELHQGAAAPTAWDIHQATGVAYAHEAFGFTGAGQTVAVIDSGIWYQHVALGGGYGPNYRVVGGWDFTGAGDSNPRDDGPAGFHGTHVAGIIGSSDSQYTGVAPEVDLVALRVFDNQGNSDWGWIESALAWVHDNRDAFENPITTVNLSLGADVNDAGPPNWAMLEDEFAQLAADGIFVSVSAGNAFESYFSPGLAYPASSPYVVPVASTNEQGELSYFSQRHSRAIAAPGEDIVSTVPDYLYQPNGVHNDWASVSGTSMAAPYVAGASVLLREALWFTGATSVTPDDIYDLMRSTADQIYDSVTGAFYSRLNVQAALDAIMPEDDYGSTLATAHQLGLLAGVQTIQGVIGRIDDLDFFTFTASATGTARFSAECQGSLDAVLARIGGSSSIQGGALTFEVVAGQQYTISLGSSAGLGGYELTAELDGGGEAWGAVDQMRLDGVSLTQPQTYLVQATRSGVLTFEAFFAHAGGDVNLAVHDASGNVLGAANGQGNSERVDVYVVAGQTYRLQTSGTNLDVDFRVTNLVALDNGQATVHGTSGDDAFTFSARSSLFASVNGVQYTFGRQQVSSVAFDGGGGNDAIDISGSSGADRAALRPGRFTMNGEQGAASNFSASGVNLETIRISGGQGIDTANFYDSAGDDRFVTRPGSTIMQGPGYYNFVRGFERVAGYSAAGGRDTAYFYDSTGDDTLRSSPRQVELTGNGFRLIASGFGRTYANASQGGFDRAFLFGSSGRDQFTGSPTLSLLVGSGYANSASGFDRVETHGMGGDDLAVLSDSVGDDRLIALPNHVVLEGANFSIIVRDFAETAAFATAGGNDRATLYGSDGDDLFEGGAFWGRMTTDASTNSANGFARTYARAVDGGADRAVFYDVGRGDLLYGRDDLAMLYSPGYRGYAYGFDEVGGHAASGASAKADVLAVDYLFNRVGAWS